MKLSCFLHYYITQEWVELHAQQSVTVRAGEVGAEVLRCLGGVKRISRLVRRPTRLFGYFLSSASLGNRHALGMSSG